MDIIKYFYQRIREKQMLHVFVQAQKREFEYIPFIETNILIQNALHKSIPLGATIALKHISNVMCSPYKKRKHTNTSKEIDTKCKINKTEKYSHYLFKKINKVHTENQRESTSNTNNNKLNDLEENEGVNVAMASKEDIFDVSKYLAIFKFSDNRKDFINEILKTAMGENYNKENIIELEYGEEMKQGKMLEEIDLEITKAFKKAASNVTMDQKVKLFYNSILDIVIKYYKQFKTNNFNMKIFQDKIEESFLNIMSTS